MKVVFLHSRILRVVQVNEGSNLSTFLARERRFYNLRRY